MTHGSLFSGIGGFDLAAEWMGWENKFHCEFNEFGQRVLKHYWPEAELFSDITKSDFKKHANRIDVLTGGFPCQPYSNAGERKGKEDERHLWPEMLRAIGEITPRWVVGENVRGLTNWNGGVVFDEVCSDLEAIGYKVTPCLIPACATNAPHKRERIWFIAHNPSERLEGCSGEGIQGRVYGYTNISDAWNASDSYSSSSQCRDSQTSQEREKQSGRIESFSQYTSWEVFPTQSPICGGDDGLPTKLDGITFPKWRTESIKAYGNAVVPNLVFEIFKSIEQYELLHNA